MQRLAIFGESENFGVIKLFVSRHGDPRDPDFDHVGHHVLCADQAGWAAVRSRVVGVVAGEKPLAPTVAAVDRHGAGGLMPRVKPYSPKVSRSSIRWREAKKSRR